MEGEQVSSYDVIIVGAGLSGLYAASILKKQGLRIIVLEGRRRVAGRQFTKRDEQFGYVELGGAYVGKTQTKILKVAEELGLELYPVRCDLKSTLAIGSKTQTYSSGVPTLKNPVHILDLNSCIREVDRLCKQVPLAAPWECSRAEEWDEMSLQDFLDKYAWTELTKSFARLACLGPFLIEPSEMSFLYFLHEVRATGGMEALTSVENGLQGLKIKGGSGSISEKLAEQLPGSILLEVLVDKITQDHEFVHVQSKTGSSFKAKRCIVTVPLPSLTTINFEPKLSPDVQFLAGFRPKSKCLKTFMFYNEQFWRNYGLNGELISTTGHVSYSVDDTKSDGSFPAIMGFIYSKNAEYLIGKSKNERKELICEQYAKEFGLDLFLQPVWYEEKCWQDEEELKFSSNCCVWSLPPGALSKVKSFPIKPEGKVFLGGTETAITFRGYMDGALRAGNRCAAQVLDSLQLPFEYDESEMCTDVAFVKRPGIEEHAPSVTQCIWILGITLVTTILLIVIVTLIVTLT